ATMAIGATLSVARLRGCATGRVWIWRHLVQGLLAHRRNRSAVKVRSVRRPATSKAASLHPNRGASVVLDHEYLLYETGDGIATITLNRPEKLNALTFGLVDALVTTLRLAEADPDVHVIVLKGAGRAFSVGLDVQEQSRPHQDPRVRGPRLDAQEI